MRFLLRADSKDMNEWTKRYVLRADFLLDKVTGENRTRLDKRFTSWKAIVAARSNTRVYHTI